MPLTPSACNILKDISFIKFLIYFNMPWTENCAIRYEIFARQFFFTPLKFCPKEKNSGLTQRSRSDEKGYLAGLNRLVKWLVPKGGLEPPQGLLPTRP
jgi:hypothetical protein